MFSAVRLLHYQRKTFEEIRKYNQLLSTTIIDVGSRDLTVIE